MKFMQETPGALTIRSVTDREIRIGDQSYARTLALTRDAILGAWTEKPPAALVEDDFAALLATDPDVIVLGTGPRGQFAPRELVFAMARRGIGFEVMDTRAAARTYNVLAAEGRQVAAVLYLGDD